MAFWVAILIGVLFAWVAVKKGFFESLVLLFNLVVSVYLAVFLAPTVARLTPAIDGAPAYKMAITMLIVGGGCFAILFGISFVLLTGQFRIAFARVLDVIGAGAMGFVSGFLAWSFIALMVTTTPLSDHWLFRYAGLSREAEQPNVAGIAWCCDRIHSVAGIDPTGYPTQAAVSRLLDESRREMQRSRQPAPADANAASTASPVRH
jgi:hypothetical protein